MAEPRRRVRAAAGDAGKGLPRRGYGGAAALVAEKEAVARAEKAVQAFSLVPKLEAPFRLGAPAIGGTHLAVKQGRDGKRQTHQLDTQVTYPVHVNGTPVIGGGGDFKLTFGDQGRLIGYSGVWRDAERVLDAEMLDRKKADEQFRSLTEKMELESFDEMPDGVRARLRRADGGTTICEATYIAGCDGAHSAVRESLAFGFPGGTYNHLFYVADVDARGIVMNGELHGALDSTDFLTRL